MCGVSYQDSGYSGDEGRVVTRGSHGEASGGW